MASTQERPQLQQPPPKDQGRLDPNCRQVSYDFMCVCVFFLQIQITIFCCWASLNINTEIKRSQTTYYKDKCFRQ